MPRSSLVRSFARSFARRVVVLLLAGPAVVPAAAGPEAAPPGAPAPSVEALLRALSSPDQATRRDAVHAARERPEPALLDRLVEVARRDPHENVRGYALEAIAGRDDPRVVPTLLEAVAAETSPTPLGAALEGLGRTRDPRARGPLLAHLGPGVVGAEAAKGLAALGDASVFGALEEAWRAHPDDLWLAAAAPEALLALDPARGLHAALAAFPVASRHQADAIGALLSRRDEPRVRAAMRKHLSDPDEPRRLAAIRVLGAVGDPATDEALLARFAAAPADRPALADALARRRAAAAVPVLAAALAAPETGPEARVAFARALGALGDRAAVPALARALGREEEAVGRVVLIEALGLLGDPRALPALFARLSDPAESDQPPQISSIWGWPWNARVADAAVWAALAIVEGKPPFPAASLSGFPRRADLAEVAQARRRLEEWRVEHPEAAGGDGR